MIETTASKGFATQRAGRGRGRGKRQERSAAWSIFGWLNLACLDAPIVAVSWQWLLARSFGIPATGAASGALFLTAWLIYLVDRFGDSLSLDRNVPASLRQCFCLRHRTAWMAGVALVMTMDLFVITTRLVSATMTLGAALGLVALLYLILNQLRPSLWQTLPMKEIVIGFLFAAGAVVPLRPGLTSAILPAWLLFAGLCSLNCVCIATWERELDVAQQRVSIATVFPKIEGWILPSLAFFSLTSLVCAEFVDGKVVLLCVALSAILLAVIHVARDRIEPNLRTALADLVLFTPLVVLFANGIAR